MGSFLCPAAGGAFSVRKTGGRYTFESGIVGVGFGDVGTAGKVAPFGRRVYNVGLWPPAGMNGVSFIS